MIQKLVEHNCLAIFKHPSIYVSLLLILTGIAGFYYTTLPTETSIESLINKNDPDLIFYEKFKAQFGEDRFVAVGFTADNIFSADNLTLIDKLTNELEQLDGVSEVISLTTVDDFIGSDFDFIIEPLITELPANQIESDSIINRAKNNNLINKSLFNEDATASIIYIKPEKNNDSHDQILIDSIEEVVGNIMQGREYHLAGWPVTEVNLNRSMSKDMALFMPITYFILSVIIFFILRNIWLVVITLITMTLCVIWTLASLNMIGGAMSPMTSILPPLMMTLAIADCIHIFTHQSEQCSTHINILEQYKNCIVQLASPCFLTSLTTAIGFASLTISEIPRIRFFGLAAATGMVFEFILTMTIIPLGIYLLRRKNLQTNLENSLLSKMSNFLPLIANLAISKRKTILLSTLIICGVSGYCATFITTETNLLEYFKKDSRVYNSADFIDKKLGGSGTIEISMMSKNDKLIIDPLILKKISLIEDKLLSFESISETTSISKLMKELNKSFHNEDLNFLTVPETKELAAQYLLLYDSKDLDDYLDPSYKWTKISARTTSHSTKEISRLISGLNSYFKKISLEKLGIEAQITGKTFLSNKLIQLILSSQINSFTTALFLIFIVFVVLYRSLTLGILSLIPNIIPILLILATMGLVGIPLNTATAVIAAVVIGITVDDTIHFVHFFKGQRESGHSTELSLRETIQKKGLAIISTSVIMSCGFIILVTASFVPTIQFGILCSLVMFFAVVADLIILPSLLYLVDTPQRRTKCQQNPSPHG